jgi:2-succinyl-5-enolpyruvyl-6-hydroxy-3-cyclohexene-1-carboxylate synthase
VSDADRAFAASWAVVEQLVRAGVEHASVSPGSRSTPIALALRRHPGVAVHVHLDERAGAFFALGVAKASGRPVVVATTSGTAAAELLPAVVEASMSRTRLIALTADRPPELRGVGANQTIEQPGLFGVYARAGVELPLDETGPPDPATWGSSTERALLASQGPPPGPVHLNLPFREPLVPGEGTLPATARPRLGVVVDALEREDVEALAGELLPGARGMFLAGTLREAPDALVELARRLGWPLIADPTSNLRLPGALSAPQFLLADRRFLGEHLPDVVVQVGAAPTSRASLELVAAAPRLVIVDPDRVVGDPARRAAVTIRGSAWALVEELRDRIEDAGETPWSPAWLDADVRARAALDAELDEEERPSEGRIARDVAETVPDGGALVVGSSMPVRDLDGCMRPRAGLRVIANRGASGIDGFVSTALGVAATGSPTIALCGDLTLLHDAGSLLWSGGRGHDAVFVVPNNDGGMIFSFLDQRDLPELEELFTTPHGLDLGAVCAAAGAGHVRVDRAGDLVPAIERAREGGGVQVVEVPVDREANVRRHAEIREAVSAAIHGP